MSLWGTWWFWVLLSYLSGSIPFALLIGKSHGVDVRTVGSGNPGATNVGRALGRPWGALCFMLDLVKGLVPVLGAGLAMGYAGHHCHCLGTIDAWLWLAVAVAAVLGHVFPLWLRFRGGKGVATSLGVVLGFWPLLTLPGLVAMATWAVLLVLFRYVSLASIVAVAAIPLYLLLDGATTGNWVAPPLLIATSVLALLVLLRHRANLARIVNGTEPKVGEKQSIQSS